jgi:hypothetical protein
MRVSMMVVTAAAAVLLFPNAGKSEKIRDPGAGFIDQKHPKVGKNFYVVREDNKCTIKPGKFGDKPVGAIGDAPYASKAYAKAALKTIPECKGSVVDDEASGEKRKKDE